MKVLRLALVFALSLVSIESFAANQCKGPLRRKVQEVRNLAATLGSNCAKTVDFGSNSRWKSLCLQDLKCKSTSSCPAYSRMSSQVQDLYNQAVRICNNDCEDGPQCTRTNRKRTFGCNQAQCEKGLDATRLISSGLRISDQALKMMSED